MTKEVWKPVVDWPRYEVSSMGRIRAIGFKLAGQYVQSNGQYRRYVELRANKKRKRLQIGKLVLRAFVGEPPEGKPLSLHKDDDSSNNKLSNLYWGDYVDNSRDAFQNGSIKSGDESPFAKVNAVTVAEIKAMYNGPRKKPSQRELGEKYGIHQATVSPILSGKFRNR